MDNALNNVEIRVLGALIEKESTTPEYYPLTLNSLTAACNQKSNRFPTTDFGDYEIRDALNSLKDRGYAAEITGGSRVAKYAQRFTEKLNMGRRETAILCVLMLRGLQTLGEIKGRTERMYGFSDLDEVELILQKLIDRQEGSLVQKLAAGAGLKEPRFAQTLGGAVDQAAYVNPSVAPGNVDRIANLEYEVAQLRQEVAELRRRLEEVL